jgi:hypothetical protein
MEEICAHLGFYALRQFLAVVSKQPIGTLEEVPIGCFETLVRNCHSMLHKTPKQRKFNLHRGFSLKSQVHES